MEKSTRNTVYHETGDPNIVHLTETIIDEKGELWEFDVKYSRRYVEKWLMKLVDDLYND